MSFNDLKNWPGGKEKIELELKVFLKNLHPRDDAKKDDIFEKLDGFLGISPCKSEEYNEYSFYHKLSK